MTRRRAGISSRQALAHEAACLLNYSFVVAGEVGLARSDIDAPVDPRRIAAQDGPTVLCAEQRL
jgi:hypothetical protein